MLNSITTQCRELSKSRLCPISLSSNELGYSVLNCPRLASIASELVMRHISTQLKKSFESLEEAASFVIKQVPASFKEKSSRILDKHSSSVFLDNLKDEFYFSMPTDYVTDEENIGFPNVYWRLVRAQNPSDVGSVHADKWFWELGHGTLPSDYRRVKVWMPLLQDDKNPSLKILPGSHRDEFSYDSQIDKAGKRRPLFNDSGVINRLVSAPVIVGQAIVFNDALLHGGQVTDRDRVSIEWTFAIKE